VPLRSRFRFGERERQSAPVRRPLRRLFATQSRREVCQPATAHYTDVPAFSCRHPATTDTKISLILAASLSLASCPFFLSSRSSSSLDHATTAAFAEDQPADTCRLIKPVRWQFRPIGLAWNTPRTTSPPMASPPTGRLTCISRKQEQGDKARGEDLITREKNFDAFETRTRIQSHQKGPKQCIMFHVLETRQSRLLSPAPKSQSKITSAVSDPKMWLALINSIPP